MSRRAKEWMQQKGSNYRNKIALVLNTWRKTHCIEKTVKILKISQPTIQILLRQSKKYCKSIYREKHTGDQDIQIQIKEKNSNIRKEVALYLRLWRKNKSINKIANILKISGCKIRRFLKLSRRYVPKTYVAGQKTRPQNKEKRKRIAIILNCWRKNHSLKQTSRKLGLNYNKLLRLITQSKRYRKSIYRSKRCQPNYSENQMKIKNSEYRNGLSKILREWKKIRSTRQVSKNLNISNNTVIKMIGKSNLYKNRTKYSENETRYIWNWSKKIWLINLKGGKCEKCNNSSVFVLEFHHTSKNKENNISNLIWKRPRGSNIKKLKKEISKCQLLCRNCHQEAHHPHIKSLLLKKELIKVNGSKKCTKCGYSKNLACMEFHHPDPKYKENLISKLGRSFKRIHENEDEIRRCLLLCCNCHAKEHTRNIVKFNKLRLAIQIRIRSIIGGYKVAW